MMASKRLRSLFFILCGLAAIAGIVHRVSIRESQRLWFLHRLGREISSSGLRPLRARLDSLPYGRVATATDRALIAQRSAALISRAPDAATRALANLFADRSEAAIGLLERIDEKDSEAWNTLAVAHMQHALSKDDTEELVTALAEADRAIGIRGNSTEAVFNRALILEAIGLRRS